MPTTQSIDAPVTERWPVRPFDPGFEPHFLFILTPPYSGSTALTEVINTSHRTMVLERAGEGQWLVPGLSEPDRWQPTKPVQYESVKSVWLHEFQYVHSLVRTVDTVIEKSPPNMMRIERLASLFRNHSLIVNNRDPYALCASTLYRAHKVETLSPAERADALTGFAHKWLARSRRLRELMGTLRIPLLTYEAFCASPAAALRTLRLPDGILETININALLTIKDYEPQQLSNHNVRQLSRLTRPDCDSISRVLRKEEELVEFFGYKAEGIPPAPAV